MYLPQGVRKWTALRSGSLTALQVSEGVFESSSMGLDNLAVTGRRSRTFWMPADFPPDQMLSLARRITVLLAALVLLACGGEDGGDQPGRIVFAAALNGASNSDLYSIEADGTGLAQLTTTSSANESFPRWSPDASRVAYMTDAGLMVANADGTSAHLVTSVVGRGSVGRTAPAWSPDGQRLVYAYPRPPFIVDTRGPDGLLDESYATTLHVIHADGAGDTTIPGLDNGGLPPGLGTLTDPAWSATGLIAFREVDDCPDCPGGWPNFWVVHEDGSDLLRRPQMVGDVAAAALQSDRDLDWSPDASQWAYVQFNGRIGVSLSDAMHGQQLTQIASNNPRWSADGTRLAFVASDGIYVMNSDGSNAHRIFAASNVRGMDW